MHNISSKMLFIEMTGTSLILSALLSQRRPDLAFLEGGIRGSQLFSLKVILILGTVFKFSYFCLWFLKS